MRPRLLTALAVFIIGLSTATSSTDRQRSPQAATRTQASAPIAHQQASCRGCHWQVSAADATPVSGENQCRSCHTNSASEPGSLAEQFHSRNDMNCAKCHSFHETARLVAGDRMFASPANEGGRYQCRSCHNSSGSLTNLSEAHRDAAVGFYHAENPRPSDQSPSQSCLACHTDGSHSKAPYDDSRQAVAINLHSSHPIECEVAAGKNRSLKDPIDPRIRLFEDEIQCQSCHSLTSGADYSLVKFDAVYDLCLGCHDQSDKTLAFEP